LAHHIVLKKKSQHDPKRTDPEGKIAEVKSEEAKSDDPERTGEAKKDVAKRDVAKSEEPEKEVHGVKARVDFILTLKAGNPQREKEVEHPKDTELQDDQEKTGPEKTDPERTGQGKDAERRNDDLVRTDPVPQDLYRKNDVNLVDEEKVRKKNLNSSQRQFVFQRTTFERFANKLWKRWMDPLVL
jgi:hypothetical protein